MLPEGNCLCGPTITNHCAEDVAEEGSMGVWPTWRTQMLRLGGWPLVAILLCGSASMPLAEPVAAHHLEGTVHGYLMLKAGDGRVLAVGDLVEIVRGDRVTAHTVFHFKDGSLDDETTLFSQRGTFHLISDHHIQKGPFFPHPVDLSIDTNSGEVTSKSTGKDGKEEVRTDHMKLPPDLYNGMIFPVTKNLRPSGAEETVAMVVATPKPRLIKLAISAKGEENFSLAGFERKAQHYEIRIELGGVAGAVAPLVGKQPANTPIVRIEQTAPGLPEAAHSSQPQARNGN